MGNIAEAEKRINKARGLFSDKLSLSHLGITSEELTNLMPKIKAIRSLRELDLRDNQLTTLPVEVTELSKLTFLHLSENQLTTLPPEIGNLTSLKTFHASSNQLTSIPPEIGNLTLLQKLFLPENQLTTLPQEIESLSNLSTLYLINNPLTNESIISLMSNLGGDVVSTNMASRFKAQNYQEVIQKLYGQESPEKLAEIEAMNTGDFKPAVGSNLTGKEVIIKFLQAVPTNDAIASELYIPATKLLLDAIFDAANEQERDTNLNILATALGDCPTPVQSLLIRSTIGQNINRSDKIPELLDGLIKREALEETISVKLKEFLPTNEKIEVVAALANSVFLAGAENRRENKVKIIGERRRIAPKTINDRYGFQAVEPKLAQEFAKIVSKTDTEGQPILKNGRYELDDKKMRAITEPYFTNLGILTEREKLIANYDKQIPIILEKNNLTLLHDKEDVIPLLEIDKQKEQLREVLISTDDSIIKDVANNFLMNKMEEVSALSEKYSIPRSNQMATPLNQQRRHSNSGTLRTTSKTETSKRRMSF
ncbi:leucine-rich repeat domain-containing protein [Ascidiimonas sp. W6]|uniref:leucine-rich repeat domain-containing protein n=1 Tax=Ascidiimonas meishanensis TaxID=3128903 RepID=UPI0030EEFD6C